MACNAVTSRLIPFMVAVLVIGTVISNTSAARIGPVATMSDDDWPTSFQGYGGPKFGPGRFGMKRASAVHDLDKWAVLHDVMEAGRRRR